MARKTSSPATKATSRSPQVSHHRYGGRLAEVISWLYLGVLALLPFHAFLTTWAGSNFGHLDAWRIWKELVIFATIPGIIWLLIKHLTLWNALWIRWLVRLSVAYMALYIVSGILAVMQHNVTANALMYSLFSNLRFIGFFLMILVITQFSHVLQRWVVKIVVATSAVVVGFGVLQRLVLPLDFLKHFGYGPDTIPAYQTVDQKVEYQRIQSTLRGANPFGAYLTLILGLIGSYVMKVRRQRRWVFVVVGLVAAGALFYTYSRSAYAGALATLGIISYLVVKRSWRRWIVLGCAVACLVLVSGVYFMRNNDTVQNTLFHTDETSQSAISSNTGRASALEQAVSDVTHEPLGRGPGTAGPASERNNHPARIAENYFLQIGQEVGWVGLALFMLITVLVGWELWQVRRTPLGLALFTSLIGLTLINLVSHAWADDTLGLLWWGLAGVALSEHVTTTNYEQNQK